ncbi:hypothetical protein, partial [Bordetella sp. LUAb4]|uniref:hypothetical protein n=1 Tax=Bordetella sp. LUAb4 TaxID=2843195 RepID=UPI001E538A19
MKLDDHDFGRIRIAHGEQLAVRGLLDVGAGVILTHVVGVNLTHLSNDGGLLAINNVDSGASSGDQSNG